MLEHQSHPQSNSQETSKNVQTTPEQKPNEEEGFIAFLTEELRQIDERKGVLDSEIEAFEEKVQEIETLSLEELVIIDSEHDRATHLRFYRQNLEKRKKERDALLTQRKNIESDIALLEKNNVLRKAIDEKKRARTYSVSKPSILKNFFSNKEKEDDLLTKLNKEKEVIRAKMTLMKKERDLSRAEKVRMDLLLKNREENLADEEVVGEDSDGRIALSNTVKTRTPASEKYGIDLNDIRAAVKKKLEKETEGMATDMFVKKQTAPAFQKTEVTGSDDISSYPSDQSIVYVNHTPYEAEPYFGIPLDQQVTGRLIDKSIKRDAGFIVAKEALLNDLETQNTPASLKKARSVKQELDALKAKLERDRKHQDFLRRWSVTNKIEKIKEGYPEVMAQAREEDNVLRGDVIREEAKLRNSIEVYKELIAERKEEIARITREKDKKPPQSIEELKNEVQAYEENLAERKLRLNQLTLKDFFHEADLYLEKKRATGSSDISIDDELIAENESRV